MIAQTKKLLIEIGNNEYYRCVEEAEESVPTDLEEAVANGIVLDGLTNGEVIQKMFPKAEIVKKTKYDYVYWYVTIGHECGSSWEINDDWWNRKWGE